MEIYNNISIDLIFNHLSCSTKAPDVTLIVEETEIPAHRAILSQRCEYFRAMFSSIFVDAKSDKIVLKEINLLTFKVVLKFIYTGYLSSLYQQCQVSNCDHDTHTVTVDQLFDILHCAQYYMIDNLVNNTIYILKLKCSSNPGSFLKNALADSNDELISYGTRFFKKEGHNLVKNKMYEQLSPLAWEHIFKLQLDTSIIFEALVTWMRSNPDDSATFPKLLENINKLQRLYQF